MILQSQTSLKLMVVKPVTRKLRALGYRSYSVMATHAGYDVSQCIPVILVIAEELSPADAQSVINTFVDLPRRVLKRCLCFVGETQWQADPVRLRRYEAKPQLGHSIGVVGSNSSFSLGLYFHFADNPNEHWAFSAHHGVKDTKGSLNPTHPVVIQQPSHVDYQDHLAYLLTSHRDACLGGTIRNHDPPSVWANDVKKYLAHDLRFGCAIYSECEVITHQERQIWSDWVAMKVNKDRVGNNFIEFPLHRDDRPWYPRDGARLFVVGEEELKSGMEVVKAGRSTPTHPGIIAFVYGHVALKGLADEERSKTPSGMAMDVEDNSEIETSEFAIITSNPENRFSLKGDSGAAVIDGYGKVCGMVLGGTTGEPVALKGYEGLGKVYCSYVTSFSVIKERLEKMSGRKVFIDAVDIDALESSGIEIIRGG